MDADPCNAPRWVHDESGAAFHEIWQVAVSDARSGTGYWLRYTVDRAPGGPPQPALWACAFDRSRPGHNLALRRRFASTALERRPGAVIAFGGAELSGSGCRGELTGGGRSLRWRLAFESPPECGEDVVPGFLRRRAGKRGSGYMLAHPATLVTGAVELDGRLTDLRDIPGGQAHTWGRSRWPRWAWARCSAFTEDPEASLDLVTVQGPGRVDVPLFTFRFRGETHRFGELPWIFKSRSLPASPAWHFAAEDATVAIDGAVRTRLEWMVQVAYEEPAGRTLFCTHTEVASVEVAVRERAFPGAPWKDAGTLRSADGAALEFCGRTPDPRVARWVDEADGP